MNRFPSRKKYDRPIKFHARKCVHTVGPLGKGLGVRAGFDVVLANPPWDQLQFDPQEYFATRAPEIANAQHMNARNRLIEALELSDPRLFSAYQTAANQTERIQSFIDESGRFPLTTQGRLNLAPLFAEATTQLIGSVGRAGVIVPSGIATDSFTQAFFRHLFESEIIASLYDFENREKLFPAVDSRVKFCLLTLGRQEAARFVFFATRVEHLRDDRRAFTLTGEDIALLNPNTRTCPVFRSQADAELTKKIYRRVPVLIDESKGAAGNPWEISFHLMFMMNTASHLFRTAAQLVAEGAARAGPNWVGRTGEVWVPLYEAKMVHQFDHRWATYEDNGEDLREMRDAEKSDPGCFAKPRYWIPQREVEARLAGRQARQWLMGWRNRAYPKFCV